MINKLPTNKVKLLNVTYRHKYNELMSNTSIFLISNIYKTYYTTV